VCWLSSSGFPKVSFLFGSQASVFLRFRALFDENPEVALLFGRQSYGFIAFLMNILRCLCLFGEDPKASLFFLHKILRFRYFVDENPKVSLLFGRPSQVSLRFRCYLAPRPWFFSGVIAICFRTLVFL